MLLMRHFLLPLFVAILSVSTALAQESLGRYIEDPIFPAPRHAYAPQPQDTTARQDTDTGHAPAYDYWGGLHEGVNVRVDLSAMAGFGHGAPHGAGFGRTIDFLYVSPIKNKWNYTLGLTSTGLNWGGLNYNDVGISGSVNYYPTENISLSLYGYKSLLSNAHNRLPYYYRGYGYLGGWGNAPFGWGGFPYGGGYDYFNPNSYIGGDVNIRFNNNTWLELHIGAGRWE